MISIAILVGGQSSRFGQNKALKMLQGQPLILHGIQRVRHLSEEILLVGNFAGYVDLSGFCVVEDILPGSGALGGLFTALSFATHDLVAVLGCDMPFVNPALLQAAVDLIARNEMDAVVPRTTAGLEPLHAVYRRKTCLPVVCQAVESGEKRMTSWFEKVKTGYLSPEEVQQLDPTGMAFVNINTSEDYEAVKRCIDEK